MKSIKLQQAERLLDAMGEIDDAYLTEALSHNSSAASKPRKTILNSPRIRIISGVAALAAVLALVFTGPLRGVWNQTSNESAEDANLNRAETYDEPSVTTLNSLLESCTESPSFTLTAADDVKYFDGNVRLTVEDRASGELYVSRPLTPAEQDRLLREFKNTGEQITDAPSSSEGYRVWITLGDGQVVTPCLAAAAGNIGAGDLFNYEPERLPTEIFFDLLKDLA